jgi:hypothetical protein
VRFRFFRPHADEQFYQRVALFVAPAADSSAVRLDPAPILPLRRSRAAAHRCVESSCAVRASTVSGSGCLWRCSRGPGTAAPCGDRLLAPAVVPARAASLVHVETHLCQLLAAAGKEATVRCPMGGVTDRAEPKCRPCLLVVPEALADLDAENRRICQPPKACESHRVVARRALHRFVWGASDRSLIRSSATRSACGNREAEEVLREHQRDESRIGPRRSAVNRHRASDRATNR